MSPARQASVIYTGIVWQVIKEVHDSLMTGLLSFTANVFFPNKFYPRDQHWF